ncbi:MAG TPA: 16S rRNA (uracil(1498)-N(3))-methyltransferase [Alphaproteobacteria bacterium]|jgi:16S rRNA (uracil1498-N3)-methyltransferase|nr:16S rRNA (uracil(1498)-N(3))-methyltransferase [Alphaproteobacteria bacterium]
MSSVPRLFVDADLDYGAKVDLGDAQAHYVGTVLRLGRGDAISLFNGQDGEWQATILEAGRKTVRLAVAEWMRPQSPAPDLWLVCAPVKRQAMELTVEKATELGVSEIHFAGTAYTQRGKINLDRLGAIAIEAAEQCGRLDVPALAAPVTLPVLLNGWPADRLILYCDESGRSPPVVDVLAGAGQPVQAGVERIARDVGRVIEDVVESFLGGETKPAKPDQPVRAAGPVAVINPWAVLCGPEGGFTPDERETLSRHPMVRAASLGPRTLRAETAALAALAVFQALQGDWRG